jgi:hypothetical protein
VENQALSAARAVQAAMLGVRREKERREKEVDLLEA